MFTVAALAAAPAHASHSPVLTCTSGTTKHASGSTRVFYIQHSEYEAYYVCSKRIRTPRQFASSAPLTTVRMRRIRRVGRRLGFVLETTSEQSASTQLGWVDLVTGRSRRQYTDRETGAPVLAWAMDMRGDMAYLTYAPNDRWHEINALTQGVHRFHSPRARATIPEADVVARSLAIAGDDITWRHRDGREGRAPLN